jgi:predicted nucleic acid-binding protein
MEMKDVKRLFVDTNILVFSTNELSEWCQPAQKILHEARQLGIDLTISSQILREYLAAATRINITGKALPLTKILENIRVFRNEFTVIDDSSFVLDTLIDILKTVVAAGKQVHDANIVATMQAHQVHHLLTHNTADFERFSDFITTLPLEQTYKSIVAARSLPTGS